MGPHLRRPGRPLAVLAGGAMAAALLAVPPSAGHSPAPAAALPPPLPRIAGGQSHSIVLDGVSVRGVGGNSSGQLTGFDDSDTLVPLAGLPTGVAPVTVAGGNHTLVVGSDGVAYGTGANNFGQLTGPELLRRTLAPLDGLPVGVSATAVAAGWSNSLVLGDDGVVYGAGTNARGQLTGVDDPRTTLAPLAGLPAGVEAEAIAASPFHTLVLGSDGTAYGTGNNPFGQLTGTDDPRTGLAPLVGLPPGVTATGVAAGHAHSLVLGSDGAVYGAGANDNNSLTGIDPANRRSLVRLAGLPPGVTATAVAAGSAASLVVGSDGELYGAGNRFYGQLGTSEPGVDLIAVTGGITPDIVEVAAGTDFTLVRDAEGVVYGTGRNRFGQLSRSVAAETIDRFVVLHQQHLSTLGTPRILGRARCGTTLAAAPPRWMRSPTRISYQWQANGVSIPGATGARFVPRPGHVGRRLGVVVTARRAGFADLVVRSARTAPTLRGLPPRYTARRPFVAGQRRVGARLRIERLRPSGFTPAPTARLTFRWYRGATPIRGATARTYRVRRADRGRGVSVLVVARRAGHLPGSVRTARVTIRR